MEKSVNWTKHVIRISRIVCQQLPQATGHSRTSEAKAAKAVY